MMRIKGEILASGQHSYKAETWFSRSLDLAREQSALAWELRTATSLAHWWSRQGRGDEAPRVLRPVYDRFDTPDLMTAKRIGIVRWRGELAMARRGKPSSQKILMGSAKKRAQQFGARGKRVEFEDLLRIEPDSATTNFVT
jgi:hypothetical protein